jgi:hypothetical protein
VCLIMAAVKVLRNCDVVKRSGRSPSQVFVVWKSVLLRLRVAVEAAKSQR